MGIITDNTLLAEELCRYSHLCYDRHLVGAAGGNLSARIGGKNFFLVTASGVALRDVSPANLVVVNDKGELIEGAAGLKASKEISFHLAVYRAKPDVNAIIHVHPTFTTVYASARKDIPLVTVSSRLKLKQGVIVDPKLPGSKELCEEITKAVGCSPAGTSVLLMEDHGLVAYRSTLCDAFDDAELVEDTAKIAYLGARFKTTADMFSGLRPVDLTTVINEKTYSYPTDPQFKKTWHADFEHNGVYVSKLEMGAHCGTHVDAPMHFCKGAAGVAALPLTAFFGSAVALDVPKKPGQNIEPADFENADIRAGDIVLFRTGWEQFSCTPQFFEGQWPGISPAAIESLIAKKAKAVGGDIASLDSPAMIAKGAPAHKLTAGAAMAVFEALVNMKEVVGRRFIFIGLPLRLDCAEASPVRAIAFLD